MTNENKIGIIYHVVDDATGEAIKVGSTIQSLDQRFDAAYKRKYPNHFLRPVKVLSSSELDWYEKKNPLCPFLWHLVAAEHLEMMRAGTFRQGPLSNKQSPLDQKLFGFDSIIAGTIGGSISGKITGKIAGQKALDSGRLAAMRTKEHQQKAGRLGGQKAIQNSLGIFNPSYDGTEVSRKNGRQNAESGLLERIRTIEGSRLGGQKSGQRNAENGHMSNLGKSISSERRKELGRLGGPVAMHNRWHVKRGIISETCKLCKAVN